MRTKLTVLLSALLAMTLLALPVMGQDELPDGQQAEEPDGHMDADGIPGTLIVDGADRYETAAQLALQTGDPDSTPALYIANGETLVDATAAGVSAPRNAKLLLVTANAVPAPTAHALQQIDHLQLIFLGGDDVISPSVREEVKSLTCNYATSEC